MTKIGSIVFFLLFFSVQMQAAESLKVEIQPESVGVGDTVQIVLTVQSTDDFQMEDPKVPQIQGLKLVQAQNAGQSSSTRMNFINGKTEFSKTVQQQFVFQYQAATPGIVTIPAISVAVNGKQITSAPQKISIGTKSKQSGTVQRPRGRPQFGNEDDDPFGDDNDPFAQLLKQRQKMLEDLQKQGGAQIFGGNPFGGQNTPTPSKKLDINTNEAFFLLLETDKSTAYEGEQITANWYIYTRGQIQSLDRAKFPDLRGFWKEIIEEVPSLQFQDEIVNGVPYRKALLASHALFPIKAGTAVIDEFKIKAKIRNLTQFGLGQLNEYTKSSKSLDVKVLPLPIENKPTSFSGAVGQFQIQTQVEGTQFAAGQPISLKVRFEGQGNAKLVELPQIDWPAGLEVYDTKSESKFFKDGLSYKEFEILVIATKPGEVQIPQINFSYFDPTLKKYVTKSTENFILKITEAVKGSSTSALGPKADSTKPIEKEFLPVTELEGSMFSWSVYKITALVVLSILSLLLLLFKFLIDLRNLKSSPLLKNKVDNKLKLIEKAIKQNDYKTFGAEAVNLLYLLTAHLAQEKNATQDWQALIYKMPESYRQSFESQLNKLFEYYQIVGFAPDSVREQVVGLDSMSKMFEELKSIAHKIVSELP